MLYDLISPVLALQGTSDSRGLLMLGCSSHGTQEASRQYSLLHELLCHHGLSVNRTVGSGRSNVSNGATLA